MNFTLKPPYPGSQYQPFHFVSLGDLSQPTLLLEVDDPLQLDFPSPDVVQAFRVSALPFLWCIIQAYTFCAEHTTRGPQGYWRGMNTC